MNDNAEVLARRQIRGTNRCQELRRAGNNLNDGDGEA